MKRALLLFLVATSGCFKAWDVGGPWSCSDGGVCAEGFTCDDAVCCVPGGTPECPTLTAPDGTCPLGSKPAFFFRDSDGDGAGDPNNRRAFCNAPVREAWVDAGTDCDDGDSSVKPLATERCNARDDNCDREIDEGLTRQPWYRDQDGDGFGDGGVSMLACAQPEGFTARAGDCDDTRATFFPGAPESCSNEDENCNGQPDDPPYLDAESPGLMGGATFDCDTGQAGVCQPGGLQCVFSGVTNRFGKTCVPRTAPSVDVCGDGIDSDCSGVADDRPGCGGPQVLVGAPGVQFIARAFDAATVSAAGCLSTRAPLEEMAWVSPAWIANNYGSTAAIPNTHALFVLAPANAWWDLSRSTRLVLPILSRFPGPSTWQTVGPVIQLCGDSPGDFARYVPATEQLGGQGAHTVTVPLAGGAGWTKTGTLDLSKVRHLEIIVQPSNGVTFTQFLRVDAGTAGFE